MLLFLPDAATHLLLHYGTSSTRETQEKEDSEGNRGTSKCGASFSLFKVLYHLGFEMYTRCCSPITGRHILIEE
jgi:hypothetical protein